MSLVQATDQIRFSSREFSYFHYANEPFSTLANNSPCDDTSLRAERQQFESDFEMLFGKKPDDFHLE